MKKLRKIVLFVLFLLSAVVLSGCHDLEHEGARLQKTLLRQEALAEEVAADLGRSLEQNPNFDSVQIITHEEPELLFYIFYRRQMVYWSDNTLAADEIIFSAYDTWTYYRFRNAHAVGRWTKAGGYDILTIIPLKHAYLFEGGKIRNTFIEPFDCCEEYDIAHARQSDYYAIVDPDGEFLFSLTPRLLDSPSQMEQSPLVESFSFHQLITSPEEDGVWHSSRARVRIFFITILALFLGVFALGIWGLIRNRGFRNMKLRTRFMYVIMTCVLLSFVYIFAMSIRYVRLNYELRQQEALQSKCNYIQAYLQNLYYWDLPLTAAKSVGLNVDLRDVGFSANADIHVFDNQGKLVGSSTPDVFVAGFLSDRMSPTPFFTEDHTVIQYEELGDTRYLCAYAPFYNGSYVQIGYIAVPSFVSELEKSQEEDNLLARLLPPYLFVLFVALFASYWAARGITASLGMVTEKMRHFQIGKPDNQIEYSGRDEVGDLVERYNAMVTQVEESAAKLAKAEREGAWRTMARQIAHEINNPLTPMKLTIQQLQRMKGTERFDAYFETATQMLIEEVDTLSRIAASFSTFAKQPEVTASEVDVAMKLSNVVTLFRNNTEHVPIRYVGPDHSVWVWADTEQISQVFTNILRNALQAMEGQADADIIVILKEAYSPEMIEISFSDNGPGIAPEVQPRVFVPNFTTKNTGMGLGLAISKNIVEGTGGKICFETSEKGTTFFVYLKKKL